MGSRMKMSMSAVLGAFDLSEFSHICDLGGLLIVIVKPRISKYKLPCFVLLL